MDMLFQMLLGFGLAIGMVVAVMVMGCRGWFKTPGGSR